MAERNTPYKDGELLPFKLAVSTKVEAGKMAAVNAAGFTVEAADTAGLKVVGVFDETVDNSTGSDGDKSARVRRGKVFKMKNSATAAVTQALVGAKVYVEDDETVAASAGPTNDIEAGTCFGVDTDGVWILIA
jgi:hypothetical protein